MVPSARLNSTHPITLGRFINEEFTDPIDNLTNSLLSLPADSTWTDRAGNSYEGENYSQGMAFDFDSGSVYAFGEAAMFAAQRSLRPVWVKLD